jgi:hypothetical protein
MIHPATEWGVVLGAAGAEQNSSLVRPDLGDPLERHGKRGLELLRPE